MLGVSAVVNPSSTQPVAAGHSLQIDVTYKPTAVTTDPDRATVTVLKG